MNTDQKQKWFSNPTSSPIHSNIATHYMKSQSAKPNKGQQLRGKREKEKKKKIAKGKGHVRHSATCNLCSGQVSKPYPG